jgi:ParB family transcriptional regulator, chromosome partitioning protein
MEVKIEDIIIKNRIRRNLGDLQPLMDSLDKFGQLNSIVVNSKLQLIAGHRRLESAKKLGWKYINAVIVDKNKKADLLEIEIEENVQRSDFSAEEISFAYRKLKRLRHKNFFKKILLKITSFFKRLSGKKE